MGRRAVSRSAPDTGCAKTTSMTASHMASASVSSSGSVSATTPMPGSRLPPGTPTFPINGSSSASGKCSCMRCLTRLSCHQLKHTNTRIKITPSEIKPICKSLIVRLVASVNCYPLKTSCLGQLQGRVDINCDYAGDTLFLHGDTNQLPCHLHGKFIVRRSEGRRVGKVVRSLAVFV